MEATQVGSKYLGPLIPLLLTILNPNIVQWEDFKETNHSWSTVLKTTVHTNPMYTNQAVCLHREVSNITINKGEAVRQRVSTTIAHNNTSRKKIASLGFLHLPLGISTRVLAVGMGWCISPITNLGYWSKLATTYSCEKIQSIPIFPKFPEISLSHTHLHDFNLLCYYITIWN
jgi:hypothetical protein